MPPVALVGIVLANILDDVLRFKYLMLLVRYTPDCAWFEWCCVAFFVLVSAISIVLFFCDLARRKWRRGLARIGLFAVGFVLMCLMGDRLGVATIQGRIWFRQSRFALLERIPQRLARRTFRPTSFSKSFGRLTSGDCLTVSLLSSARILALRISGTIISISAVKQVYCIWHLGWWMAIGGSII